MMRSPLIFTSLLLICAALNSCQKEFEDPNDSTTGTTVDFKAKISGSQFVANKSASATKVNGIIALTGTATDGQGIVFSVADSGVHVYILDINSVSNTGTYQPDNGVSFSFTSNGGSTPAESGGNLAIVSIDPVNRSMSGTFNFKAFRPSDGTQKIITEGVFNNIPY